MRLRRPSTLAPTLVAAAFLLLPGAAVASGGISVTPSIGYESRAAFIRALDIALGLPPSESAAAVYTDVPKTSPYYGYIEAATAAGFVNGTGPHQFSPTAPVTRAEAAKIEVLAFGAGAAAQTLTSTPFKDDATIPSWARGYVAEAARLGLLQGFPDRTFGPQQKLTQAQETSLITQLEAALKRATPAVAVGTASVDGVQEPVLTDAKGMTLYYFAQDTPTQSACSGTCAQLWPPLLAPGGVAVTPHDLGGRFSVVRTANGEQIAYDGHLLYTYAGDSAPGQATGVSIADWYVATPELGVGAPARTVTVKEKTAPVRGVNETVLTDAEGMTLYYFAPDTATKVACSGACAEIWPPLTASEEAAVSAPGIPGTFGLVDGPNGPQVEYDGHPLYGFIGDTSPGEATGDGFKGIWHAATVAVPPPAGVATVRIGTGKVTIAGQSVTVLTNAQGRTLYYLTKDTATDVACQGACARIWPPLTVAPGTVVRAGAGVHGTFSLLNGPDGTQVEYDGHPLYTFSQDTAPGQATGQGFKGIWYVATPGLAQP